MEQIMAFENQVGALIGGLGGYFLSSGNTNAVLTGAVTGFITPDVVKTLLQHRNNPEVQRILIKIVSSTTVGLLVGAVTGNDLAMALATLATIQINNYYRPPLLFRVPAAGEAHNQNLNGIIPAATSAAANTL
jgi:uncharacterized protein YcfJ